MKTLFTLALVMVTLCVVRASDDEDAVRKYFYNMAVALEKDDQKWIAEYLAEDGFVMIDHVQGGGEAVQNKKQAALEHRSVYATKMKDGRYYTATMPYKIEKQGGDIVAHARMIEIHLDEPTRVVGTLQFRSTFTFTDSKLILRKSELLDFKKFELATPTQETKKE